MRALHDLSRTIVAPATTTNQSSALGIVRLSGALALKIAKKISDRKIFRPRVLHLCSLLNSSGAPIDQGLVVYFPAPFSSTGEDVVEFQTHGNPLITSAVVQACCAYGAVVAQPGEFLYRAFWHGKYDLTQIEGIADLISGRSQHALFSGMTALSGGVSERLQRYASLISGFRCQIESAIDFADQEDVQNSVMRLCSEKLQKWIEQVESDLGSIKSRFSASAGCDLILIGPPNAGKSSFLNYLADEEVSIIDSTPGTTRDIVTKQVSIRGVPVTLQDTAGLRETTCSIEKKGIEKAKTALARSSILIYISPDNEPLDLSLVPDLSQVKAKKYLLFNKTDISHRESGLRGKHPGFDAVFGVSLQTGEGLQEWKNMFESDLLGEQTEESKWLANARQQQYLEKSLFYARQAYESLSHIEIAAQHLKDAQDYLGLITGERIHDDLLEDIFSSFCIGK